MNNHASWNLELDIEPQSAASNNVNECNPAADVPKILDINAFLASRKALAGQTHCNLPVSASGKLPLSCDSTDSAKRRRNDFGATEVAKLSEVEHVLHAEEDSYNCVSNSSLNKFNVPYSKTYLHAAVEPAVNLSGDSLFATIARPGHGDLDRYSTGLRKRDGDGEATLADLLGRPVSQIPQRIRPTVPPSQPTSSTVHSVEPVITNKQQPLPNSNVTRGDFRSALVVEPNVASIAGNLRTTAAPPRRMAGTNLRRLASTSNRDRFAFVTPFARSDENNVYVEPPRVGPLPGPATHSIAHRAAPCSSGPSPPSLVNPQSLGEVELSEHERLAQELIAKNQRLRGIEPKLVESILSEILDDSRSVTWAEIAGLGNAKRAVREAIVLPLCNPRLFEAGSIRAPPRGVLLFGPPGNGKTMIGKCVASQVRARFFAISSSALTSKWVGDGEKLVRALFLVAAALQPAVIFIDEIDALLSKRSDSEHESSRRMKTEFLVQMDGVTTCGNERVLVIGATNRPDELDEAARRRFPKRIYVPLPDEASRKQITERLLSQISHSIQPDQLAELVQRTEGFSAADLTALCREAAMYPIRELASSMCDDDCNAETFGNFDVNDVRATSYSDLLEALARVKPTVSASDLERYETWNNQFGMLS